MLPPEYCIFQGEGFGQGFAHFREVAGKAYLKTTQFVNSCANWVAILCSYFRQQVLVLVDDLHNCVSFKNFDSPRDIILFSQSLVVRN